MQNNYIERRLFAGDKALSEGDCLAGGGVIVVLAEPGAGKTELLNNFANRLGVRSNRASIFRHSTNIGISTAVVIDALDEVARQDQSAVDQIIVKALDLGTSTVVFASRSYEWGNERNRFIEDCIGKKPTVVRLSPFDESEQKALFDGNFPNENFDSFLTEASKFGLTPVLGNPMFFQLFVEGYIQGGRSFNSKHQIFKDAVVRLATDDGKTGSLSNRPSIAEVVAAVSEVFAKLLLSGATGVSTVERLGDQDYPYVSAISNRDSAILSALNSRLFKLAADVDLHEPVHRIVAEYCAAQYLAQRMNDPADWITLRRCIAVVAPNGVVRDELRGLLGWLAALGNKPLQETLIELDPYAVLANGDPAQLAASSKKLLLCKLRQLSEIDPYFRRSDAWRRFNVAGFFTQNVIDEVRLILGNPGDGSHLQHLILELLQGAEAAESLTVELRALMLDPENDLLGRLLALRCLVNVSNYDSTVDFQQLLNEGSLDALKIAAEFATDNSFLPIEKHLLLDLLRRIATPANQNPRRRSRYDDSRYFIKELIGSIDFENTVWLLDNLTVGLSCTCGAKKRLQCHCRAGISKMVGRLLDRYFELTTVEHDPKQIWEWIKKLKFEREASLKKSRAVKELQENTALRQSIHILAFEGRTSSDQIWETSCRLRWGEFHMGLCFSYEDVEAMADYAFDTDNVTLWISLAHRHNRYAEVKERDALRARMRAQARDKPEFMREWAKRNRQWCGIDREDRYAARRSKRFDRRDKAIRESNLANLKANRALIEQGEYWFWNREFARYYLHFPDQLSEIVDDIRTAEQALANCFTSLAPHTPTIGELANREKEHIAEVLYAGCLVRFRVNGSLAGIDESVLRAVKTVARESSGCSQEETELFEAEIDAQIFQTVADVEAFAREYIEPTLMRPQGTPTNLWWLESKAVQEPLRAQLATEWLERYPAASLETTGKLFDISAMFGDCSQLKALIEQRCDEMITTRCRAESEDQTMRRKFWFLRHLFFAVTDRDDIWREVLSEPDDIFALENYTGLFGRDEALGWPALNAEKVFRILDAYVSVWPKVFLPSSWGTGSPKEETAYRFLTEVIWQIGRDDPDHSILVIDRMLSDSKFSDFFNDLRSMRSGAVRKRSMRNFTLPAPSDVVSLIDKGGVASVEDMRALVIEELEVTQRWLKGAETDPLDMFWPSSVRVDENTARNRIVEKLQDRMTALNTSVVIEHHMAGSNRCDFTASKVIDGRKCLLVCEVKGQWHTELFSAAASQLNERYSVHPDAAQQGIYLVLWFGTNQKVAGRKNHSFTNAGELRTAVLNEMPVELHGLIDVYVLDLSK